MRYLKSYPVDLCATCDLATNWSDSSVGVRNDDPVSEEVCNVTAKGDDRNDGERSQKKILNAEDFKPEF